MIEGFFAVLMYAAACVTAGGVIGWVFGFRGGYSRAMAEVNATLYPNAAPPGVYSQQSEGQQRPIGFHA